MYQPCGSPAPLDLGLWVLRFEHVSRARHHEESISTGAAGSLSSRPLCGDKFAQRDPGIRGLNSRSGAVRMVPRGGRSAFVHELKNLKCISELFEAVAVSAVRVLLPKVALSRAGRVIGV